MALRFWLTVTWFGFLLAAPVAGQKQEEAQEQEQASRIIDRIFEGEREFLVKMQSLHPILEAYVQEFREPNDIGSALIRDHYMLGRFDMTSGVDVDAINMSAIFQKPKNKKPVSFLPAGWAQMVILDRNDFDRGTYDIVYTHREFLGEVRCLVFEVSPLGKKTNGRFKGAIWVEDQQFRIVRFSGIYTGGRSSKMFFHFDSWRVNTTPGLWLPAFVYVEEASETGKQKSRPSFKAQTRLWGYSGMRTAKLGELSDIQIESEAPVVDKSGSHDMTPLEGQRLWEKQAEQNVILRLERGSLIAPKGEVDQVLNTVVNNLMATNHIDQDVQCRVLLTTPFETFSIGQTIVISRGLLDVLPDEASLAMVLAEELAHIALGHRSATGYAFGDQMMFNDGAVMQRLHLSRTPHEMETAASKALQMLANSPYSDKLGNAGLFLKALHGRVPYLPNLVLANLGSQFASESNIQQLAELTKKAPPLEESKIEQIAALPLGSRIKLDIWSNEISLLKNAPSTFLSARDKMPFEVAPVAIYLTRPNAYSGTQPLPQKKAEIRQN